LIFIVTLALALTSCTTPDAVAKFCASAVTTLASANAVFGDMKLSCLREVNSRQTFGTFKPPSESDAGCDAIGVQGDGAAAAAKILSDYFSAVNALASFGTAKVATDAQALVSKTSAAVGAGTPAQTAIGSIANFLVSAAASGYQQKQLEKDLTSVSGNIPPVLNALVTIVQRDYIGLLLASEEQKLTNRYREFAKDNSKSPEVLLMLDSRWQADEAALNTKRASAQSLASALQALSKGFASLAASSHRLTAKEVPALLGPYVTQIQALIPQIQKAF
jgi:hypothetical protein